MCISMTYVQAHHVLGQTEYVWHTESLSLWKRQYVIFNYIHTIQLHFHISVIFMNIFLQPFFFSYRIVFGNRKHLLFISVYFKAVIFYTLLFTPCASHFPSTWCSSVALQIAGGIIFNTLHLQCSYLCSASLCWILMSFVAAVAQLKFHLVVCLMDDYLDAVLFFSTLS